MGERETLRRGITVYTVYLISPGKKHNTSTKILESTSLEGITNYLENSTWYINYRHTTNYCVVEEELAKGNSVIYIEEKLDV